MSKKSQICCDSCGRHFVESEMPDYRIELSPVPNPTGTTVYSCICYPPIDEAKDFCGLGCLKAWLDSELGLIKREGK